MNQAELIQKRFDLELALLQSSRKLAQGKAALRLAKYNLREAKIAQVEYGGSFKSFRDKLTGKREESETALRHTVQKAEAELAAAQQTVDTTQIEIPQLEEALSQLPAWESLRDPEHEALWCRLEARYCIEWLTPHLEITHQLLLERRSQFNGTHAGEIRTLQELSDIYSAPEAAGEACKPLILRLQKALDFLNIPCPTGTFFDTPTAFLSEATKFTRMDRINTAIVQTEALQRTLLKLQKEFTQ